MNVSIKNTRREEKCLCLVILDFVKVYNFLDTFCAIIFFKNSNATTYFDSFKVIAYLVLVFKLLNFVVAGLDVLWIQLLHLVKW